MTRRRCTSAIALGAIVCLCAVVIVVWVQFSQGAFDRRQQFREDANDTVREWEGTTRNSSMSGHNTKQEGAQGGRRKEPSTSSGTRYCDECRQEIPTTRWAGHLRSLQHTARNYVKQEGGIELVRTSFRHRIATYRLPSRQDPTNVKKFLGNLQTKAVKLVGDNVKSYGDIKVGMELFGRFLLQTKEASEVKSFNTKFQLVSEGTDLEELFSQFASIIEKKFSEFNEKDSEFIEKTHLDDLGTKAAVFVKPRKINPDDENQQYDQSISAVRHHSGHFRHKSAEIWDPHPKYEIDAYGQKLLLELEHNDQFVAPDLHIVSHGTYVAHRRPHDPAISGCFYTGKLKNDPNSAISVDLCHGMTGYIRSSTDNYYIEPAENFTSGSLGTILHRIKKLPHTTEAESNDVLTFDGPLDVQIGNETATNSIVEDDFPEEIVQSPHIIKKREVIFDDDVVYDSVGYDNISPPEVLRSTRDTDWNTGYSKRSNEYFIKVLVVADSTMLEYHHNHEELTKYILILMSHVALLFKEASIGNAINVAVVHIRIFDDPKDDFSSSLSHDMLRRFCEWKQRYIFDKSHDVALLLTRRAICKNQTSCATLGVAEVDSMCKSSGCTIVRDKGLSTSYTIAHEFGHTLSMVHDDDNKCGPYNSKTHYTNNIMIRTTKNDSKPFTWSACSKQYVTDFLDSPKSKCLLNPPSNNEILSNYTQMLPGDSFEVDKQCELEFGPGHTRCTLVINEPLCVYLWCKYDSGGCISQWSPWAEGTKCGPYSWCYKRECIREDRRQFIPIDGRWGEWQPWGECSRTCGGGIKKSVRYCDSPTPENGGNYCTGKSVQYKSCNTEDCDGDEDGKEFRAIQCAQFNGITKGLPNLTQDVQWIPKYGLGSSERTEDYCRLYCKPQHSAAYYSLKDKVLDGTKCGKSGFDICVNGMCRPGGCNNLLDSNTTFDECGVCGGDNSSCQEITGVYNRTADQVSYNKVVRIPKGSSNMKVTQHSYGADENFLALRDAETGEYILNGNQMLMTQEMDVEYGPITIKYSGSNAQTEWVSTTKTTKLHKDLVVEVLSIKNLSPPNISFRYVISKDAAPRYGWQLHQKEWSKCSSICEGVQYRKPICLDLVNGQEVDPSFCDSSDIDSATEKRQCNNHCSLTWHIASKSACSPHCGKGYRRVYYKCMKLKQFKVDDVDNRHCNVLAKPPSTESCYTPCNTTRWDYSTWSECSKTCGGGTQRRSAKCVDENNIPIDDSHCTKTEKIVEQICSIEKCPDWRIPDVSPCSVPCGGGYQNVTSYCVLEGRIYDNMACDQRTKPPSVKRCNEHACGRWAATDGFLPCSVTCGEGVERKRYICKKFDSEEVLDQEYCRGIRMPREESRKCFKECDRKSPYFSFDNQRYNYDVVNENSVYNRFDRYRTFQWTPGEWSACSQTCDGGISTQTFVCRNELGEENPSMCDLYQKPQNNIRCNDQSCPKWKVGDWSPNCDSQCERHRQVRCLDDKMTTFEDNHCDLKKKPQGSTKCPLAECPHAATGISRSYFDTKEDHDKRYRWKVGAWRQCSTGCGKGERRRVAECEDSLNDIVVVDSLCTHKQRPKTSKPCERYQCKYAWIEGPWASCSATCGHGVKSRNVTCHKVHQGGIVDPMALPQTQHRIIHKNYCNMQAKPSSTSKCLLSHCGDEYMWQPEEWKACSQPCGRKGRQFRVLNCISVRTKQKVARHFCPKSLRPIKKRKCNQWKCLYKSCKEIKHYMRTKENREYMISLRGRAVNVYCYKMDTNEPQEYISLHADKENYAEIYDRRLFSLDSCPYGGERRDNCPCDQIGPERSGVTKFWKVRVNITSLQIIGDDFTFSKQVKGTRIPYGTSGDCYSSHPNGCPQGKFSVDLTHTSFKLGSYIRWKKTGPYASGYIRRSSDTLVHGKCGGYCGECLPDPAYGGLKVEIT